MQLYGSEDENLQWLLRLTARLAFVLFVIAFIARPLRQILRTNTTAWLLRERRSFGLAFAAVHLVHAALIFYLAEASTVFEFEFPKHLFGGAIYVLIVLMMITSFDKPARWLGAKNWRRLHKTGLYVIALAFVQTLLPNTREELLEFDRMWFVVLVSGAAVIRLTAYFAIRKQRAEARKE